MQIITYIRYVDSLLFIIEFGAGGGGGGGEGRNSLVVRESDSKPPVSNKFSPQKSKKKYIVQYPKAEASSRRN